MPNVGPIEIIVILLIALVVFGPKRIPELGRSVGHGMRNFKQSVTGRDGGDDHPALDSETAPHAPSAQPEVRKERPAAAAASHHPSRAPAAGTAEVPPAAGSTGEPCP